MTQINRRNVLTAALATASATTAASAQDTSEPEQMTPDQTYVMGAGMTAAEAKCWKLVAEAAGAFFALPELHPRDNAEVESAIHIIQNKLLTRPTYRKYIQLAKAGQAEGTKVNNKDPE